MNRRSLALAALSFLLAIAAPAVAQTQDAAAPPSPVRVAIETTAGTILAETDPRAPVTSANFLRYVDERRFDGADFYRGMQVGPAAGLIQGGTTGAPERVLPPIAHEPTSETGLSHTDGALSMARFDPGTATGDFFIIVGNLGSLDAGRGAPGDPGFAVFGRVIEGMEVVRQILAAPKSATEGEGFMRGQMLDPRIRIVSVRRVEAAPATSAE